MNYVFIAFCILVFLTVTFQSVQIILEMNANVNVAYNDKYPLIAAVESMDPRYCHNSGFYHQIFGAD